jgi:hypothetical protein
MKFVICVHTRNSKQQKRFRKENTRRLASASSQTRDHHSEVCCIADLVPWALYTERLKNAQLINGC